MKSPLRLGFIGFGEAGSLIAKGLGEEGLAGIRAYDICLEDPARRDLVINRAKEAGVELAVSTEDLIKGSDLIIAAVTSAVALSAATGAAPYLTERQVYVDINSVSPDVKKQVGQTVAETGARFVEVSVMAAVPKFKHKVPLVLCGPAAGEVIQALSPYGMTMEDFGPEFGRAAAFKMFRSIMIKGMEALLLEMVLAASEYDISDRVLESVEEGYPGMDWTGLASYLIGRTAIHGERRAHEMEEVSATLDALGIDPIMAQAAAKRISWGGSFGLREEFNDQAPDSYKDVINAIRKKQGKT
jgi:3-hydroxyisobutyrate dehydrogenase-like beta-hydroxyacid dehydrogenase